MTLPIVVVAALGGAFTWTLLEYVMHRFLGHDRRLVRKTPFGAEHTAHHSRGNYFAPAWKKALFALLVVAVVAPLGWLVMGEVGFVYAGGLVGGYLVYEALHALLHMWAGVGPWARWARRHHFFHHFHDPSRNHGVTTPLWDIVFGTYTRPARVVVPKKLAMRWLVDPATGEVWTRLADEFELRGRAA